MLSIFMSGPREIAAFALCLHYFICHQCAAVTVTGKPHHDQFRIVEVAPRTPTENGDFFTDRVRESHVVPHNLD
jgi:hypothetical protein